jgi:hypothetical protein
MKRFFGWISCKLGMHGKMVNTGLGWGGVFLQGRHLGTECRTWRCERCGIEIGVVKCPLLPNWGPEWTTAEFVRKTTDYRRFEDVKKEPPQ